MPDVRNYHRHRAKFEREMADESSTNMARIIHEKLAEMHSSAADARIDVSEPKPGAT